MRENERQIDGDEMWDKKVQQRKEEIFIDPFRVYLGSMAL